MDEQREQAYIELVQQQGQENQGKWLKNIASQLAQSFNRSKSVSGAGEEMEFLMQLLQAVEQSPDPQVLYPLLQANLNKVNLELAQTLKTWANQTLPQLSLDQQQSLAATIFNFSSLIKNFPFNRSESIEIAITGYGSIGENFSRESLPQHWAGPLNNLAVAYYERIKGDRGDNLEQAILLFEQALTVHTQTTMPVKWAMTLYNLGNAYRERIKGDRGDNIEQAIHLYQQALTVRTQATIPVEWAETLHNLALAYFDRIKGDRGENIEQAIHLFKQTLTVHTQTTMPVDWAGTLNNLAAAYSKRIKGDRGENIEQAIHLFKQTLTVHTQTTMPVKWALTLNNLANAYSKRIKGDRGENIEQAIHLFKQALTVRTQTTMPVEWAGTLNNLANAYSKRIKGDRGENIEQAILLYQPTLTVHTQTTMPVEWALTLNNLAAAYFCRIKGDRGENLEQAIHFCTQALTVRTQTTMPVEWAETLNNLALAYSKRIKGNKGENIEQAINLCKQALTVSSRENLPLDWADIINVLANAYTNRIQGDREENIEQAINLCKQALTVRTQANLPLDWAEIMNNLANAYLKRVQGNKGENIEKAIATYEKVFVVYTQIDMPVNWAATLHNLAIAYHGRIKGDRGKNIEQAIQRYRAVLKIYLPNSFPLDCLRTGRNLGNLGFNEDRWDIAIEGYTLAIAAVETSRSWATDPARREEIQVQYPEIYNNIIYAHVQLGQYDQAFDYAERSRSRRLVELMATADLYDSGEVPPQVQTLLENYQTLQSQIDQLNQQFLLDNDSSQLSQSSTPRNYNRDQFQTFNQQIKDLEAQKQRVWQQIWKLEPEQAAQLQVEPTDLKILAKLLQEQPINTAILSCFSTEKDTYIFILRHSSPSQKQDDLKITLHTCSGQGIDTLQNWILENWLRAYFNNRGNWYPQIPSLLNHISQSLNLHQLIQDHLQGIEELIIVPHLSLHQIPFAALPISPLPQTPPSSSPPEETRLSTLVRILNTPVQDLRLPNLAQKTPQPPTPPPQPTNPNLTETLLGDRFRIRILPNCQILEIFACRSSTTLNQTTYASIEDTHDDLQFARFEGQKIADLFNISPQNRLIGQHQATKSNYQSLLKSLQHQSQQTQNGFALLSSHHATSRIDNPLESKLVLGDSDIPLSDLLSPAYRLPHLQEVFLSCCETGLGMVKNLTDDILTLSHGFLYAGARTVISTLWAVDDLATALFSIFYHNFRQQGFDSPDALQKAQKRLRELTGTEFEQLSQQYQLDNYLRQRLEEVGNQGSLADSIWVQLNRLPEYGKCAHPFADPHYWSAFVCQGLAHDEGLNISN